MTQSTDNPYSPPNTNATTESNHTGYEIDRKMLVIQNGATLPKICIKTGANIASAPLQSKTLYWIYPAWALLILLGLIPFLIAYILARKKVTLHYYLSETTLKKKRRSTLFSAFFILLGAGFIAYYVTSATKTNTLAIILFSGVISIIVGLIILTVLSNQFRVKKHKNGAFHITGFNKKFLKAISPQEMEHTS